MGRSRKPCDGSGNCYLRHIRNDEKAPARCKRSYTVAMRRYNATGIWAGDVIYGPEDAKRYRTPGRLYPETPEELRKAEKTRPKFD